MDLKITFNTQVMSSLCKDLANTEDVTLSSATRVIFEVLDQEGSAFLGLKNPITGGLLIKNPATGVATLFLTVSSEAMQGMRKTAETLPAYIQQCVLDEINVALREKKEPYNAFRVEPCVR